MEDAGFQLWDTLMWLHGQGFPKATAMDLLIDKKLKKTLPVTGQEELIDIRSRDWGQYGALGWNTQTRETTSAASDEAKAWVGYKTNQLKPGWEPCLAFIAPHKNLSHAECALKYGTSCLNIDGCREAVGAGISKEDGNIFVGEAAQPQDGLGRYPANVILDEETSIALPEQASRFYYCAKASPGERNGGLGEEFPEHLTSTLQGESEFAKKNGPDPDPELNKFYTLKRNFHPCVKPIKLCEYLAKLILPPSSVIQRRILVPFSGSGSEIIGCVKAGWDEVVGVEMSSEYCAIAQARVAHQGKNTGWLPVFG